MALQVTSREFRNKQAAFLNMADNGEQIVIHRGKKQAYILVPVSYDDFILSPEADKRIAKSRKEYLEGKTTVCKTAEEALAHLKK